jgi:hypothetical protein
MSDRRCRFGLAARIEMVRRRQAGESLREIAAAMACWPTTVKAQIDLGTGPARRRARTSVACTRAGRFRTAARTR